MINLDAVVIDSLLEMERLANITQVLEEFTQSRQEVEEDLQSLLDLLRPDVEAEALEKIEPEFSPTYPIYRFLAHDGETQELLKFRCRLSLTEDQFFAYAPWLDWTSLSLFSGKAHYDGELVLATGKAALLISIEAPVEEDYDTLVRELEGLGKLTYDPPPTPEYTPRLLCR